MKFTKMHGAGNDYVVLDGLGGPLPRDMAGFARRGAVARISASANAERCPA